MLGLVLDAKWEPRPGYVVSEHEKRTGKANDSAQVWRYPSLSLQDLPSPQPGQNEVLLNVQYCGVSSADVHFYKTDAEQYMLFHGCSRVPVVVGHEFSAIVESIGKKVSHLKPGMLVTVEQVIWCGECSACRSGLPNLCQYVEEVGFTVPGGFADSVVIGAKHCWPVDDLVGLYGSREQALQAAALCEPASASYNALFNCAGGFRPGSTVVVHGAGAIGLSAVALARTAGAAKIIVFENELKRQQLARKLRADSVFSSRELDAAGISIAEVVMELTNGAGAEVHVAATGSPERTFREMELSLALNGKIILIGRTNRQVPMDLTLLQSRRGNIFCCEGHSGQNSFPNVIRLMVAGLLDLRAIIAQEIELAQVIPAIKSLSEETSGGKTLIRTKRDS